MADNPISVDAIELSVKTSADSAASSVKELKDNLHELKGELNSSTSTNSLKEINKQLEEIEDNLLAVRTARRSIEQEAKASNRGFMPTSVERRSKTLDVASVNQSQAYALAKHIRSAYNPGKTGTMTLDALKSRIADIRSGMGRYTGMNTAWANSKAITDLGDLSRLLATFGRKSGDFDLISALEREGFSGLQVRNWDMPEMKKMGMSFRNLKSIMSSYGFKTYKPATGKDKQGQTIEDMLGNERLAPYLEGVNDIRDFLDRMQSADTARHENFLAGYGGSSEEAYKHILGHLLSRILDVDVRGETPEMAKESQAALEALKQQEEELLKAKQMLEEAKNESIQKQSDAFDKKPTSEATVEVAKTLPTAESEKAVVETAKELSAVEEQVAQAQEQIVQAEQKSVELNEKRSDAAERAAENREKEAAALKKLIEDEKAHPSIERISADMVNFKPAGVREAFDMLKSEYEGYDKALADGNGASLKRHIGNIQQWTEYLHSIKGALNEVSAEATEATAKVEEVGNATASVGEKSTGGNKAARALKLFKRETHSTGESASSLKKKMKGLDDELKQKPKDTKKASSAFKSLGSALKSLRSHTQRTHSAHRGLLSQLGRVAKMRTLRWIVRSVAQGFKEGADNLYQYSKAMKTAFAGKMDSAASALLTLKNSIATAVAPLIEMLLPALQKVVGWVREAANWLAQVFAQLNGQSTWTRAKDAVVEYAEAAKDAKNSTKGMLAAFDELNVISSKDNGSGSSKKATDYKSMFEEVATFDKSSTQWANRLKKIIDKVKEALGWVKEKFDVIKGVVLDALKKLAPVVKEAIDKIMPIIKEALEVITPMIEKAIKWVAQAIEDIWPYIKPILDLIKENMDKILPVALAIKFGSKFFGFGGGAGGSLQFILSILKLLKNPVVAGGLAFLVTLLHPSSGSDEIGNNTLFDKNGKLTKEAIEYGWTYDKDGNPVPPDEPPSKYTTPSNAINLTDPASWFKRKPLPKSNPDKNNILTNGEESSWWGLAKSLREANTSLTKEQKDFMQKLSQFNTHLRDAGVSARDVIANWDVVKPLIDQHERLDDSAKLIISLIDKYGDDWVYHISEVGGLTWLELIQIAKKCQLAGEKIPEGIAKGISADKTYKGKLAEMLKKTKLGIDKIQKLVNNTKLTAPVVQTLGYEKSLDAIWKMAGLFGDSVEKVLQNWNLIAPSVEKKGFDRTLMDMQVMTMRTGVNIESLVSKWNYIAPAIDALGYTKSVNMIKTIARETGMTVAQVIDKWDMIAPYINYKDLTKSINDITLLIARYPKTWQQHLGELTVDCDITPLKKKLQDALAAGQSFAQAIKSTIQDAVTLRDKYQSNDGYNYTDSATGQKLGVNNSSSSNSSKTNKNIDNSAIIAPAGVSYSGYTGERAKTGSTALDAFLGIGGKTVADVLAMLPYDYPKIFTKPLDYVKQYSSKTDKNSKTIEVWNLTAAEVGLLQDLGYTIKKNWGKTDRGWRQIKQFYTGGYDIPSGDLFMANEAGRAELVGKIGNRTAVANQNQIISGISDGVRSAMRGIEDRLIRIEQYAGITADKEFSVKLAPSVGLGRVNAQSAALYSGVTGR